MTGDGGSLPSALPANEVLAWVLDPAVVDHPDVRAAAVSLLTPDEHARAERFVFRADRDAYISARTLMRTLLLAYSGAGSSHDLTLVFNDHGKPALAGTIEGRTLAFNVSHTRGLVACAVGWDALIGVDVEGIRDDPPLSVASNYFAAPEIDVLRTLDRDGRRDAFYATWTLKEAFIKARGQGLAIPLDSFAVSLTPPQLLPYGAMADTHADWRFAQWRPAAGFVLAACWSGMAPGAVARIAWLAPQAILAAARA